MMATLTPAEAQQARGLIYRFLGLLYLNPPDSTWLAGLARDGMLDDPPIPLTEGPLTEGFALLAASCRRLTEPGTEAEAQAIQEDYERLFVGPGHLLAPPWESVYRSRDHLVLDWPTLEVREAYRQAGLSIARPQEPDDHVGIELLFLATLCERAANGDEAAESAQRAFVREHLCQWLPRFCQDVREHAQTDFWRGVSLATEGFLQQEARD